MWAAEAGEELVQDRQWGTLVSEEGFKAGNRVERRADGKSVARDCMGEISENQRG